jgi:hypothetical protein
VHPVTLLGRIAFVMGVILLAPPYSLFVERMREPPLDPYNYGFVIRVRDDNTL